MIALRLTLPKAWNELNSSQLRFVAAIMGSTCSRYELLIPALMQFTGIRHHEGEKVDGARWFTHPEMKNPFILENDQLTAMADKLGYLMDIQECHPLKWIRKSRARHFRLYNATFEEYLLAENYFFAYSQTYQEKHLDNMMAVLYRKPWERFNADKVEKRANYFRSVPSDKKNAMFLWYVGFRSYVRKRCPNLFSGSGKEQPDVRRYINGIIHTLNNGDITITDKLMKQPAWYALDELEQRARIYAEQEAQNQRLNSRR